MSTNPEDIHRSIEEHINKRCKEIIEKEKLRLNNEFNKKNSRVEELLDEISNTRKELDEKEELMVKNYNEYQSIIKAKEEAIERACKNTSPNKYIKINIGGKIFETLEHTLASISPYFARLLSDDFAKPITDLEGNIFIDTSPIGFQAIINWARLGKNEIYLQQIFSNIKETQNQIVYELFMKTIDYFGINYENLEISVGREIKIYWRGDRTVYGATIISSGKDLPKIQVQYHNDGECWEYDYIKLKHKTGVYKNLKANSRVKKDNLEPLYWHYGKDKGSKIIETKNRHNLNRDLSGCYINPSPGERKEEEGSDSSESDSE